MPRRVLVVDDMRDVVKLVGKMLGESGYDVLQATSGQDALAILQSQAVDALVTDIKMPQMSGPELVQRLWEFAPDLPVVFMTGYSVEDDISCEMLSRALLITKPFTLQALRNALAQALDGDGEPAAAKRGGTEDDGSAHDRLVDPARGAASSAVE